MANKIKVVGYSKETTYNGDVSYRNFSPDLIGAQLGNEGGTSLFTMGNFAITTNLDPKSDKNYITSKFSEFVTLDTLKLTTETIVETLKNNTNVILNLDKSNLKYYALFGSMVDFIRVSLENIITKWPASLYLDPVTFYNSQQLNGYTYENYEYDSIEDTSTFKINTTFIKNNFQVNYLTNGTIIDTFNESNDLRNLTINYLSYSVFKDNKEYDILGFTGSTYEKADYIYIKAKGNPFSGLTTNESIFYHIKPLKIIGETFFNALPDFENYLLNRKSIPLYNSTFNYSIRTDNGILMYTSKSVTWPVSDGYNIDFNTPEYNTFATEMLNIATNYDLTETGLMKRFLVSESISDFDSTPVKLDPRHQDTTTGQKVIKTLNIYGRAFDDINKFIESISFAHVVTYDKKDNVPDNFLKDLSKVFGWDLISTLEGNDLISNYVTTSNSSFLGESVGLTAAEADIELWRRLILNSPWIWKSKGARKSIEFLLNFIGVPQGLITFNEHIYKANGPLDMDLFVNALLLNDLDTDLSRYPIDEDGYPKPLPDTNDMYFQNYGLWFRETAGTGSTVDITTGNNPHIGSYDGGTKYINQFRTIITDFKPVTISSTTVNVLTNNLFINYNLGNITNYNGKLYIDVKALDGSNVGDYVVYNSSIITNPMPQEVLTSCGCDTEGKDDALSICVKTKTKIKMPCEGFSQQPTIDNTSGFYVFRLYKTDLNDNFVQDEGFTSTSFIGKECCKSLGGTSSYLDSDTLGHISNNTRLISSGYVCCTTNKCGCNSACKWLLKPLIENKETGKYDFGEINQPLEIPINSGNLYLDFNMFRGKGGKAVTTTDGSNCPVKYTTPSRIVDPYTNKVGVGCKLTMLGQEDMALGDESYLNKFFNLKTNGGIGCCVTENVIAKTYTKSLYE